MCLYICERDWSPMWNRLSNNIIKCKCCAVLWVWKELNIDYLFCCHLGNRSRRKSKWLVPWQAVEEPQALASSGRIKKLFYFIFIFYKNINVTCAFCVNKMSCYVQYKSVHWVFHHMAKESWGTGSRHEPPTCQFLKACAIPLFIPSFICLV